MTQKTEALAPITIIEGDGYCDIEINYLITQWQEQPTRYWKLKILSNIFPYFLEQELYSLAKEKNQFLLNT